MTEHRPSTSDCHDINREPALTTLHAPEFQEDRVLKLSIRTSTYLFLRISFCPSISLSIDTCIPGSTRGGKKHPFDEDKKRASREKNSRMARLHKFDSGVLHRKNMRTSVFVGIPLRFFTEKCQQHDNIYEFGTVYGLLREFEQQHETNKMPTTNQQVSTFCQHRWLASFPS